ncbi:MAG: hypothetical protein MUE46_17960 [Xanthomonadales bacterium]|jgi:uncharacterized membrane protein|nr:hypothetical protein [Xanthomonadales bacterium]
MSFRTVDAGRPVEWIKSAFATFMKAPLPFVVMTVVIIAIGLVANLIPVLGAAVAGALSVYWVAGFQYAARKIESGGRAEIPDLFVGLSGDRMVPLAYVAAVPGGVNLLFGLLGLGMPILAGLMSLPAGILVWLIIYFAVPRVLFDRVEPVAAMQQGVQASLANIVPLIVVTVLNVALLIAGTLALLIGLLVALPVMFLGSYYGYRDVYGGAAPAMSPGSMPPPPPGPPGPPPGY